jgi:RNA polymerase subunit RPABC4/transcription elongation factor Spt4
MRKKECPSCAMDVDEKAKICPVCGYEFPVQHKIYILVAIVLLLLSMWFFIR